jgi:hypothetical protein
MVYNEQRLHGRIGYITPQAWLAGPAGGRFTPRRDRKLEHGAAAAGVRGAGGVTRTE